MVIRSRPRTLAFAIFTIVEAAALAEGAGCSPFGGAADTAVSEAGSKLDGGELVDEAARDGSADVAYATLIRNAAPSAYWRLGDTAGTTAIDDLGLHPGQYLPTFKLGQIGAIAHDDDTAALLTKGIRIGDVFDFASGAPFSFEAWVAMAPLPPGDASYAEIVLISKFRQGSAGWHVYVDNQGHIGLDLAMSSKESRNVNGPFTPKIGQFHHLVATYDAALVAALYVNGDNVATKSLDVRLPDTDFALMLGAQDDDRPPLQGKLDEVALYPRALTSDEVLQHYRAGTRP